jgi:hypothetical protein
MSLDSALDLPVPRNLTSLLQHLQRLVGREGHHYWCGGTVPVPKLPAFMHKMEQRYPLLRNTRERSYDRRRGRAVVHMVVYPLGHATDASSVRPDALVARSIERPAGYSNIAWWLVSGPGTGGLLDPSMPDAHVCRDAVTASGHIVIGDYVLAYFTKKEPRRVINRSTGRSRTVLKDTSTWTWKLRADVVRQARAAIDECCARLEYGAEDGPSGGGSGLRGLLATQRSRPLFSGVRSQIIDLHRYARDAWEARRATWTAAHPELVRQHGADAGTLRSVSDVIANRLPKMVRLPIYDELPRRVRDLLRCPL